MDRPGFFSNLTICPTDFSDVDLLGGLELMFGVGVREG